MESIKNTFISSTFWTERIGPTAALKTLEIMEREKSWEVITKIGKEIRNRTKKLANNYDLKVSIKGIPALTGFSIDSKNSIQYKTLITQEMLSNGYLAGDSVYVCTEHTQEVIDGYFKNLENIFKLIQDCENGRDIKKLLKDEVCHTGFRRLT